MSHTVELLAVGTELLLGNIVNTDSQMLSEELSALGLNVYYQTVVGDNPARLRRAVEIARERADILITTGGLGPTTDDLTKNVLARVFGKRLVFDEDSARRIKAYFDRIGRPMTENNLQQAMLPEGCTILQNDWGTAPGCLFEAGGVTVVMLPGPPKECRPMFRERVRPLLENMSEGVIRSRTLKIFGIGESSVEAMFKVDMDGMDNPTLAPYAKEGEVELRLTAKAPTVEEAEAMMDPEEEKIRARLGDKIYGVNVPSMEAAVIPRMKERSLTLGTAESCTGGMLSQRLTSVPGASAVFRGAVVSYSSDVKRDVLGVSPALLEQYGAVSDPVARAMAEGARRVLGCDAALSVTGVAGPDSDDRGNPVGLVFLALAAPDGTFVRRVELPGDREKVRHVASSHALDLLRRWLDGAPL